MSGIREAEINVAEGKKQARILSSEAYKLEQINQARGEAEGLVAKANAKASAVRVIADAIAKQVRCRVLVFVTKRYSLLDS